MHADERAQFAEYVAARHAALLRTAYLLVGDRADAEDLLQTALAKTYLAWHRIDDKGALDTYVRRAMLNTRTSWWRRRRDREHLTDDPPERAGRDATADLDLHDALWSALATLSKRQRAMVVLRYYEELTEGEVAHLLGVSTGTVKSTVSRALVRLRAHLARDERLAGDPRIAVPDTVGASS